MTINPAIAQKNDSEDICNQFPAPAPIINIIPTTASIKYDYSQTSGQLSARKTNTKSPYGLNVDTTTGGLRHDKPEMDYQIKYSVLSDKKTKQSCMAYTQIDLNIKLQPTIYIAKEYNTGNCGKMVLGHEKKHVTTDRWVINKYSKALGEAIQHRVNAIKVVGPFATEHIEHVQQSMLEKIQNELDPILDQMMNEMEVRQGHVDTLEEYERVTQYCDGIAESIFMKRRKK